MSEVASIKNNVAYKDLKSHKLDSISPSKSIYRFHKNSVTLAGDFIFTGWGGFIYTINYERLFPLANNVGMSGRVGLMPSFSYGPPPFLAEVNFLIGKSALIFESAFGLITILDPGYGADLFPYIRINYRLQTSKRFLFKIGPTMYIEEYVFFAAGITLGVTF